MSLSLLQRPSTTLWHSMKNCCVDFETLPIQNVASDKVLINKLYDYLFYYKRPPLANHSLASLAQILLLVAAPKTTMSSSTLAVVAVVERLFCHYSFESLCDGNSKECQLSSTKNQQQGTSSNDCSCDNK